jgi:hypothetical protein
MCWDDLLPHFVMMMTSASKNDDDYEDTFWLGSGRVRTRRKMVRTSSLSFLLCVVGVNTELAAAGYSYISLQNTATGGFWGIGLSNHLFKNQPTRTKVPIDFYTLVYG